MTVLKERRGDVAIITLNNPPVNAIGQAVRQNLRDAIDWVETQTGLSHVVLTGQGHVFAAGGDAREFDGPALEPHLPDIAAQIEASETPWVAALNGLTLGGGAELALACRYRIATEKLRIGFPEVLLGVVPGAGGTQRLPRLVGVDTAARLVSTGRPVGATDALNIGLINEISDNPVATAVAMGSSVLSQQRRVCELPKPVLNEGTISRARAVAEKKMRGQHAPLRALELIEISCNRSLREGLLKERQVFLELRASAQSKALRHLFFADRAAGKPSRFPNTQSLGDKVAVVGGGFMGAGIAASLLSAGFSVILLETDGDAAVLAASNVSKIIDDTVNRGLISDSEAEDWQSRLTVDTDFERAKSVKLAIEVVTEDLNVKKQVFAKLEALVAPDTILATNTSYLDVDEIAETLIHPTRFLGLHFFAPAHVMKLLEIVKASKTSDAALASGFELARMLRKTPVLAGVCEGFIGNRILSRYRAAAEALLLEGQTPEAIDQAMCEFGYPMGPFEAQDLSGLDIAYANRHRQRTVGQELRYPMPISDRLVELGRLGRKAGRGWYDYEGSKKTNAADVTEICKSLSKGSASLGRRHPNQEVADQLVFAMISEACDILDEDIAETQSDIDLVTTLGFGFPKWRGGLMHYAGQLDAGKIVEVLARHNAKVWAVSPSLKAAADTGRRIGAILGD